MNTKTFAQQSRNLLMDGVAQKLLYWGFDENGQVIDEPQKISGGYLLRGVPYDDPNVPKLWAALKSAITRKGIDVVVEEAAYTWFNRMMAMKILAKNGYDDPVLDYAEGMEHTPLLLQRARQGQFDYLSDKEKERLRKVISDFSKDQEVFALLLVGYCHNHRTLNTVFGKLDDHTELLLPDNMLQESGFLHLLNTTDAISDEDYQKVELIGWLYQFYISQRKDEVFASFGKGKKAEAKDIPAATQIFTPNWIVKYMVENTAGKIWLDKHPDSSLKGKMKYLVENESDGKGKAIISNVEELTLIDPAAGSGHILVEGFDLLYQMYMEEYYPPEEAVESILKNNLFGLDIDDRAAQLATFAILLKAASRYRDVFTKGWLPHVYAMPEAREFSLQEVKDFLGSKGTAYVEELKDALRLMKQAKNLGSIMKLKLSEATRNFVEARFKELENGNRDFNEEAVYQGLRPYMPVLLLLTEKYAAAVANPPYMGQKTMNADLKNYANGSYSMSKSDLMTIFMEVLPGLTRDESYFSLINLPSWMFLSSYAKLRLEYVNKYFITSLLQMGRGVFGADFGSVCFCAQKDSSEGSLGVYRKLYENFVTVESVDLKRDRFLNHEFGKYLFDQLNFLKLPSTPIAYWISQRTIRLFESADQLNDHSIPKFGMSVGDGPKFIRTWHEVSIARILFEAEKLNEFDDQKVWGPLDKGGSFRRWYGNMEHIVNWQSDGRDIRNHPKSAVRSPQYFLKPHHSWTLVTAGSFSARFFPAGFLIDTASNCVYFNSSSNQNYILGLLNSKIASSSLDIINPTINYSCGVVGLIPFVKRDDTQVESLVQANIKICKTDWDCREYSWNFEKTPVLNDGASFAKTYDFWLQKVTQDFFQLHANEEDLNRIFINVYGLQDELSPEVLLKDITILQDELDRGKLEELESVFREKGKDAIELPIKRAEVISQFISYAIGLFMGRYRLDKPGLNIAHPNPTKEELANYTFNGSSITIDEDAILPLMGSNSNFKDDALQQLYQLLDAIWGHETRTENINFIQECLDKDLEKFLVKDFYKYHCGMYKKKPIYWLFSSPKGAFQVLVYMHRMNEFTVEKIRANYLLEHIKKLRSELQILSGNESSLSTQEAKRLDKVRKDLQECEQYDLVLKNVADQQIKFDLDDGVDVNYKKFESVVAKIK